MGDNGDDDLFAAPFLEQSHPLAAAVGAPQVAAAAGVEAAVVRAMITVAIASNAGSSIKIYAGSTSNKN